MATKKKTPARPTAAAYTPAAGATGSTAADTSTPPPIPTDLGGWVLPGASGAPAPTPAAAKNPNTLHELAQTLHVTGTGADLENKVIEALAQHYNVRLTGATPAIPGRPDTRTPAEKANNPNVSNPFPENRDPMFANPQQRPGDIQQGITSAEPQGGGGHPATTTTESNTKALADIARASGAKEPSLEAIAQRLGTGNAQSGTTTTAPTQVTAAEDYSNLVKRLSDPKYKAQMTAYLEAGNFLNATVDQGSPNNAAIGQAYLALLQSAKDSNTSVSQAYQANQASSELPGGQQPAKPISETAANIQGMGERLGIYLSPQDITYISDQLQGDVTNATGGPSTVQDEIKNMVVQYFNPDDPRNPPGAASDMYQQLLQASQSYGLPVDNQAIMSMVKSGIQNSPGDSYSIAQAATDTTAAATTHFQQLAAGLYPSLAPQILSGQKVADLISPYNSITAQYTGVDPASLNDPGSAPGGPTGMYYSFLQGARDPKSGAPVMQTMDEWRKTLMQDPQYGFQKTQGAQDMAEQLTAAILNEFGRVNTMGGTSTPVQSALPGSGFQGDLSANTSAG